MPLRLLLLAALAATVLPPSTTHAQELADIDGLIARGRFTDARTTLVRWREQHPRNSRDASPDEQAFALLLTGRLARDAAAAEDAYLALALGYPTSAHAPPALLRLGQGLLAAHEAERARGYLERLVRDYPNAAERAEGMLWLARAQRTTGRATLACTTARTARTLRDLHADTAQLLQHEERIACARDD
jgi:hypothetical protein